MENRKHILVCDDNEGVREAIKLILGDFYELSFCEDGEGCCQRLLKGENFDLLLLDIKMPGLSGFDVLRKIKETKPDLKVIAVTGYRGIDAASDLFKAGAIDYITKPFSSKEVQQSVERNI